LPVDNGGILPVAAVTPAKQVKIRMFGTFDAQGGDLGDGLPQHQGRSSFVLVPDDPGAPAR
jgi:hypothetical protein